MNLPKDGIKTLQTKNWINTTNQTKHSHHAEMYEMEKKQMFIYINNLITKLSIDMEYLRNSRLLKLVLEEKTNNLKKEMELAHKTIDQLKVLINNKKSCLLPENNITKNKQKCEEWQTKVNWMEKSLNLAIVRYNDIGNFLKLPENNLYTEIKKQKIPFKLNFISKKKKQEMERELKFKETQLILSDLRSPMELLKSRIVDHGITPTYRFIRRHTSGQQFIYDYSCTLFGMYVEGSGNSKSQAKENASAEMLRSILKKQKSRTLSTHIRPFNEKELKTMSPLIKFKTNYVDQLEKACIKNKYQLPIYTLLSQSKDIYKLEKDYSIQCDALDLVAIGHSNKRSAAKQMAAQNILNLWEKMNSKRTPSF